jgi:pyridoxamine 5'-phosphate oxidase
MLKLVRYSHNSAYLANGVFSRFSSIKIEPGKRIDYQLSSIDENAMEKDPFLEFYKWHHEARKTPAIREADAVIICTANKHGFPSARPVLLKSFDHHGFVFCTSYRSRKSQNLSENPNSSLTFYWDYLEKCVRIEGKAERISEEESTAIFHARPREAQIGAWASPNQSAIVTSRFEIDEKAKELTTNFEKLEKIPKPDYWGGWRVRPTYFEFWQGRQSRLHDRVCFQRETPTSEEWKVFRLSP